MPEPCPYCRFVAEADDSQSSDMDLLVQHIDDAHDGSTRLVTGDLAELVRT